MKKLFISCIATFLCLFYSGHLLSQTHTHGNEIKSDIVTDEDLKNITNFDEKAALNELKLSGMRESEWEGALNSKKIVHILKQRGFSEEPIQITPQQLPRTGPCDNAGFDYVNFTNWTGATGTVNFTGTPTWTGGILSTVNNAATTASGARQTILTAPTGTPPAGYDPNARNNVTGAYQIPLVAPGGSGVSVRLGNAVTGNQTEKLEYQIAVTPSNTSFTYQYAVVLESPAGHDTLEQPKFEIKVKDQNGNVVTGPCGVYSIEGLAAATDTSFKPYYTGGIGSGTPRGYYKKWTTVGIDLTPYINTTVTIEFRTMDCTLGGHYGYAYIDASCSQLQATVNFCPNDSVLLLSAPGGYNSYQWYDGNNNPIAAPVGTNDTLVVQNPILGQLYTVSMLSASGCGSSLSVTLGYSNINVLYGSNNVTCYGDNDGFAYVAASGAIPPFTYSWIDSTSGTQVSTNDSLLNAVAGTYYVTVFSSGGCSASDTITITQPPNLGDSLDVEFAFCPGDNELVLYAPEGYMGYVWHAGNDLNGPVVGNDDSLVVFNPSLGFQYYLEILTPPPGCHLFLDVDLQYQPPPLLPDYKVLTNTFTPNNDGKNDYFDLSNFQYVKEFKVEIFNRWGKRVFVSYDMSVHWDGKIDGKAADDGIYYWMAQYKQSCHEDAPVVKSTGFVHVLR